MRNRANREIQVGSRPREGELLYFSGKLVHALLFGLLGAEFEKARERGFEGVFLFQEGAFVTTELGELPGVGTPGGGFGEGAAHFGVFFIGEVGEVLVDAEHEEIGFRFTNAIQTPLALLEFEEVLLFELGAGGPDAAQKFTKSGKGVFVFVREDDGFRADAMFESVEADFVFTGGGNGTGGELGVGTVCGNLLGRGVGVGVHGIVEPFRLNATGGILERGIGIM